MKLCKRQDKKNSIEKSNSHPLDNTFKFNDYFGSEEYSANLMTDYPDIDKPLPLRRIKSSFNLQEFYFKIEVKNIFYIFLM